MERLGQRINALWGRKSGEGGACCGEFLLGLYLARIRLSPCGSDFTGGGFALLFEKEASIRGTALLGRLLAHGGIGGRLGGEGRL